MSARSARGPTLSHSAGADLISHLTQAISATLDLPDVLNSVTESGLLVTGAEAGLFLPEYGAVPATENPATDSTDTWAVAGTAVNPAQQWSRAERELLINLGRTCRDSYRRTFDDLETELTPLTQMFRSVVAAPVVTAAGERLGTLLFMHSEPEVFDATSELYVRSVASHAAVAISNARLYAAEKEARTVAEHQAAAMSWLQRLTAQLARVTDWSGAVESLRTGFEERHPVDRIQVHLDTLRPGRGYETSVILVGDEPVLQPRLPLAEHEESTGARPTSRPSPHVTPSSRRKGRGPRPAGTGHETRRGLRRPPHDETSQLSTQDRTGLGSTVTWTAEGREVWIPFSTDTTTGWLHVVFGPGPGADTIPEALLLIVAGQLASTLERVRLFEAEAQARKALRSHVARVTETSLTLQRSLLPTALPEVPDICYATRYTPATRGHEVGGDWYDVISHRDGSATFIIGDVEGHSIGAAVIMGKLSTALHAYLLEGHPLDVALRRVNPLVEEAGVLATCTLINLKPSGGIVHVARAGHPLPLASLARLTAEPAAPSADGAELATSANSTWEASQFLEVPGGPPLGVPGADWPLAKLHAPQGLRMLLYTDGLVERRTTDVEHELSEAFDDTAVTDLDEVLEGLMGTIGRDATDDVALIAVEMTSSPAPVQASMELTCEADVSRARALASTTLESWGLDALRDDAALVVSELCTNAVRYAGGHGLLTLTCINPESPEGLVVEVADRVPHEPRMEQVPDDALGGRGLLLVEAVATDWMVEPRGVGKVVRAFLMLPGTNAEPRLNN